MRSEWRVNKCSERRGSRVPSSGRTWLEVAVHDAQLIVAVLDTRQDLLHDTRRGWFSHTVLVVDDTVEQLAAAAELL